MNTKIYSCIHNFTNVKKPLAADAVDGNSWGSSCVSINDESSTTELRVCCCKAVVKVDGK